MIKDLTRRLDRVEERRGGDDQVFLVCMPDRWEPALTEAFDGAQDRGDQERAMAICAEVNGVPIPRGGVSHFIQIRRRSDGPQ